MSDPNLEINPYTNRQVKKCGENEERIPIENGDWKTFKCYKRCHPNQMRNMRTMRCRKQKQDYELYPSPSSVRGSNDMRKTKKNRSSTVNYNLYPSPSSVRGSNDLRKPKKSIHPRPWVITYIPRLPLCVGVMTYENQQKTSHPRP